MWATWSRRRWPRPSRRRPAPINIGTGIETDVLELVAALGELGGAEELRARVGAAPHRRGAADLDRPGAAPSASWAGAPQMGLDEGLRLTLDSI